MSFEDKQWYSGLWSKEENKKEGFGVQVFEDRSVYEGYWLDGYPNGKGRVTYPNGAQYLGDFVDGVREG